VNGVPADRSRDRRRTAYFAAGLAVVAVALSPPLDGAAARKLSAHMAQHLLLILAAAPLLVAARPGALLVEALPVAARARLGRTLHRPGWRAARRFATNPVVVLTVAVGGFWAWHLPRLYEAALHHDAVHGLEHVTFLAGGFLFWTIVLDPGPKRRLGLGATCGFVFAAMLTNIWLSATLAFATTPLYRDYAAHGAAALADQQLAGVLMWVPADAVYFVTLLMLFRQLLRDVGVRRLRREAALAAEAAEAAALLGADR
jgi:cytochrome c oxidase assembly factor CtaG